MLFGRDYEDYRKYLYEGYSLLIKGSFKLNTWRKEETWDFKIKSMVVLNNAREELVSRIDVRLSLDDINETLIEEIKTQTSGSTGKATLKFSIYDESEGISLELFSRNTSVTVTNELMQFFEDRPELSVKVS